jgi:hypothetical protein
VAGIPVTAGSVYTLGAWAKGAAGGESVRAGLQWWNAGGAFISRTDGTATVLTAAYGQVVSLTATAPVGTAFASVSVLKTAVSAATFNIDGIQLEQAAAATTYCDGTQPWCYWTGAAHASASGRVTTIAGPDWFFESKKFDAGAALRLKRIKQLAIHFLSQGDGIAVDTVLGLNNIGTTLTAYFPASVFTWDTLRTSVPTWVALKNQFSTWNSIVSAVFIPKRVRFLKRSQHFSFRLYARSTSVTRARIGPYEIGYKLMRPGRV